MSHKIKFLQKLDKNLSLCLHLFFCSLQALETHSFKAPHSSQVLPVGWPPTAKGMLSIGLDGQKEVAISLLVKLP